MSTPEMRENESFTKTPTPPQSISEGMPD